jgi:hypothetical protein
MSANLGPGFTDSTERNKWKKRDKGFGGEAANRVDETRVDADQIIKELVSANLAETDEAELQEDQDVGLQLYVGKDGTATLGSRSAKSSTGSRRHRHRKHQEGAAAPDSQPSSGSDSRQSSTEKENGNSV